MILFKDCGQGNGEFQTPGRQWTCIREIPENQGIAAFAPQLKLIDALFEINNIDSVGFDGDIIRVGTFAVPWNEIRPNIEAVIEVYAAA